MTNTDFINNGAPDCPGDVSGVVAQCGRFIVLFVFGGDTLLEAMVQVALLAASALLGICGPAMERRWRRNRVATPLAARVMRIGRTLLLKPHQIKLLATARCPVLIRPARLSARTASVH